MTAPLPAIEARGDPRKAQSIRDAALVLFRDHGYGAVSMDQVARGAGVSKATLYAHFGGKESLFADIVRTECARSIAAPLPAAGGAPDPAERLAAFARGVLGLLSRKDALAFFRMIIAESHRFPELGRIWWECGPGQIKGRLAELLTGLSDAGILVMDDPELAAEQFLGMLKGNHHMQAIVGLLDVDDPAYRQRLDRTISGAVAVFLKAYRD